MRILALAIFAIGMIYVVEALDAARTGAALRLRYPGRGGGGEPQQVRR